MIKKISFITFALILGLLIIDRSGVFSFTDGTPAGYTGSPSDKNDCSVGCHKAKPELKDSLIVINATGNEYEPGKTYTLTATLTGKPEAKKFGFQISPQGPTGKLAGKMVVTNVEETKLVGNGKYLNQIAKGVNGNGSKTWSFDWIAPAAGSGNVTFYGSFLIGGKPEIVYNTKLALKEKK
ncbi:MAG: Reeler domain-containing protein [Bacteroidota bacterium]